MECLFISSLLTLPVPTWRKTNNLLKNNFMSIPFTMPIAASVWLCKLISLFFYFLSCIDLQKLEMNYGREYILKRPNTFCSIIPLAIAYNKTSTRVWRRKEGSGIWWSQQHPGLAASVRQVFNQLLGNKLLLHKVAGPISKAAADLCKPFPFAEEIHFHQVQWEHAHWEEIKLLPPWEWLICSQYLQRYKAQPEIQGTSLFRLSNQPGSCVLGIPLHKKKSNISV